MRLLRDIHVTTIMLTVIISNLDHHKATGHDIIPVLDLNM